MSQQDRPQSPRRPAGRWDDEIARYLGQLEKASADPRQAAGLHYELSRVYWDRAGRVDGREATAEALAADRQAALEHAQAAVSSLEACTDEVPPGTHGLLGRSLGRRFQGVGRTDEAIDVYQGLLDRSAAGDLDRVRTLHELGKAYAERGGRRAGEPPTGLTYRQDLEAALKRQTEALELAGGLEDCPPTLLASINNSLGLIYAEQSQSELAAERFAEAERLCAEHAGPAERANVLVNLIPALIETGRFEEVRTRIEQLKTLPEAATNPRILAALGVAFLKLGDFEEAATQFGISRTAAQADPDCLNDQTFMAQLACNIATCAQADGDYDEAERGLLDAQRRLEAGGVDPRTSAVIKANLGRMYLTLERLDEAEAQLRAVYDSLRELQGPQHVNTLLLLIDLANLARLRGHFVEAEQNCRDALQGLIAVRGENHPLVAQALLELASALLAQGRGAEALTEATRAMGILDATLGADHKQSVMACLKTALISADCRELPGGEERFQSLFAEAAKRFRKLDHHDVESLPALVQFADITARTPAAYDRALERYDQAEEGFLEIYGDGALTLAELRLQKGRLLERMGRQEEAFRVYGRALRSMDPSLERHPQRAELLAAVGDLYQARGETDRAGPLWAEAYRTLTATYGAEHPRVKRFRDEHRR